MGFKYPKAKLVDDILSTIIETSHFSLFEIGECFRRLDRSFDRLLEAIDLAKKKGWALSRVVDVMELEEMGTNGN